MRSTHQDQPVQLRLPANPAPVGVNDRARGILLQLPVDVPNWRLALLLIGFGGLLVQQLLKLGIAISGIISLGAAMAESVAENPHNGRRFAGLPS